MAVHPLSLPVVLLLLASPVRARLVYLKVLLTYQSQGIPFTQWIELFTVCLAPLVTHVAAGAPSPTIINKLKSESPSWTSRLTHFNPISIIWRYNAIADRRVRARSWDELDMAACNAVFWNGEQRQWDGSEEIMVKSRRWITKTPDESHIPIVSQSTLITLASTLQGAQAIALILGVLIPNWTRLQEGLPYLFVPLSVLSLLRVPAAPWLTNEHGYLNCEETTGEVIPTEKKLGGLPREKESVNDRLLAPRSWQGIAYRIWWVFSAWLIMGTSAVVTSHLWWKIGPGPRIIYKSTSATMFTIMYFVFTATGPLIITAYVILGQTRSTIIPCIHSAWYKVYTLVLMTLALTTTILAAIETRINHNGAVTTYPEFDCSPSGGGPYGGFFPVYGRIGNCTSHLPRR